jgi:PASTA domain
MTQGAAATGILVATGPNDLSMKAQGDEKQPTSFSGNATYTVSNKGSNRLTVLMSGRLVPAPAGVAEGGATDGGIPANVTVSVTPPRVVLDPGANAQAKVDLAIPAGTAQAKAMLEMLFRDEQKPNEIFASYTSSIEVPESKKPTNWKLILLIVAIIVIVLIGAALAFFLFKGGGGGGKSFALPDVHNMSVAAATDKLKNGVEGCKAPCFDITTEEVVDPDPTVDLGNVIKTDPASGAMAKIGSTVRLTVMKGVSVPSVANLSQIDATKALTDAGLKVNAPGSAPSFDVPAGTAMYSNPPTGAVVKTQSGVTITVSAGSHTKTLLQGSTADLDSTESPSKWDVALVVDGLKTSPDAHFTKLGNGPLVSECAKASSSSNKFSWKDLVPFSDLTVGAHACVLTSKSGNAELIVKDVAPNFVTIEYVVWSSNFFRGIAGNPGVLQQALKQLYEKP